ncbi:D-aminoacyl-tRNA deacylase [Calycomorphotria hydatis]|uniref:D-aminoacyl-tRNA deacylase n=1 Tax=Calycomorphotria hydatis TaxID=2528027 RepID=A0A517TCB8_9PLAN|nr:D-aminoacyl-tRNA deacylase [Calycomorphotria hydatis]QDT66024.1 D-tyrosyl-tRNA(Tyr) deacylase [Calycomorphotria hydatis]
MRAVVQRVSSAHVDVDGETIGKIERGLLVLLGVGQDDSESDVTYLAAKVAGLRIFEDDAGKMNRSVMEIGGGILVVSQFTLWGDCRKGKRPSFIAAAEPAMADELYERFVAELRQLGLPVETGKFRAHMDVHLTNDGPVTLMLDSQKLF